MNEKKIIIGLLAIFICLNIVMVVFLFMQQKKINTLALSSSVGLQEPELKQQKIESISDDLKAKIKEDQYEKMLASQTQVIGSIKEISDKNIIIQASVPNFSDIKNTDLTQSYNVPVEQKELKIIINDETKFEGTQKAALKKDDLVAVEAESSIVNANEVVAKVISLTAQEKEPVEKMKSADGKTLQQSDIEAILKRNK